MSGNSAASGAQGAPAKPAILELRYLQLRNTTDGMGARTNEFLAKAYVPALKRAGVATVGAFGNLIAPNGPFDLLLTSYASMSAWEEAQEKLAADETLKKDRDAYYAKGLGYTRAENTLLRGFRTVPNIEVPKTQEGKPARVFELRTYESNNPHTLARKIKMFDEGEIDLFRKLGMVVVFFGETIAGQRMPNLTYMLGYNDLAHRESVWRSFVSSPEWKKMSTQPGVSDGEIVSNISAILLRPLPFSTIR